jgi:hypothetical protein
VARGLEAKSLAVDRGRAAATTAAMVITKINSLSSESRSAFMMTTLTIRTITAATRFAEYILGMVGSGVGFTSAVIVTAQKYVFKGDRLEGGLLLPLSYNQGNAPCRRHAFCPDVRTVQFPLANPAGERLPRSAQSNSVFDITSAFGAQQADNLAG